VEDYKRFASNRTKPFVNRIDDWHLLLFITQMLSPEDARGLVEAVKTRNAGRAEGFRYLINDLLGLSE